jgi:hypothetical protein
MRRCWRSETAYTAPIFAKRIGSYQARAAQWVRLASASYGEHVARRTGS